MARNLLLNYSLDKSEKLLAENLIERIGKAGGQIKLQHLFGHISQISGGKSLGELRKFIQEFGDIFKIDKTSCVSIIVTEGDSPLSERSMSDDNLGPQKTAFPQKIENGNGVVIKTLPTYGFIISKDPKCTVYFTPSCFKKSQDKERLLNDIVKRGQKVIFNAIIGNTKFESQYRATSVWFPENPENEVILSEDAGMKRKTRETGLYDGVSNEGEGTIQKVFPDYGFILIENNPKNTVFFYKRNVTNIENVMDLTKVLKAGDLVEYKATRSSLKDAKARWQATKVWIKKAKPKIDSNCHENSKIPKDETGKVYPRSTGVVIKFGKNYEQLADADSCHFYMHGRKVTEVSWEFSEGDVVEFSVLQIKSYPHWKALLAWKGDKPPNVHLPSDLGESDDENNQELETNDSHVSSKSVPISSRFNKDKPSDQKVFYSSSHQPRFSKKGLKQCRNSGSMESVENVSSPSISPSSSSSNFSRNYKNKNRISKKRDGFRNDEVDEVFHDARGDININSLRRYKSKSVLDSGFVSPDHSTEQAEFKTNSRDFCNENFRNAKTLNFKASNKNRYQDKSRDRLLTASSEITQQPTYSNWGDSPYPDEEEEVVSTRETFYFNESKSVPKIPEDKMLLRTEKTSASQYRFLAEYEEINGDNEQEIVSTTEKCNFDKSKSVSKIPEDKMSLRTEKTSASRYRSLAEYEKFNEDDEQEIVSTTENCNFDKSKSVSKIPEDKMSLRTKKTSASQYRSLAEYEEFNKDDEQEIVSTTEKCNFDKSKSVSKIHNDKKPLKTQKTSANKCHLLNEDNEKEIVSNSEKCDNKNVSTCMIYNTTSDVMPLKAEKTFQSKFASLADYEVSFPTDEEIVSSEDASMENSGYLRGDCTAASEQRKVHPYIKHLRDLQGKVVKVYCRYAELESDKLMKHPSLIWTDFFRNGVPVPDKFEDLKDILKPNQSLKFDCIEIVDDSGDCFQKVTVAWEGKKPNFKEISPQEYIKQNNLTVSVCEEKVVEVEKENIEVVVKNPPLDEDNKSYKFLIEVSSDSETESNTTELIENEDNELSNQRFQENAVPSSTTSIPKYHPNIKTASPDVTTFPKNNSTARTLLFETFSSFADEEEANGVNRYLESVHDKDSDSKDMAYFDDIALEELDSDTEMSHLTCKISQMIVSLLSHSQKDVNAVSRDIVKYVLQSKMANGANDGIQISKDECSRYSPKTTERYNIKSSVVNKDSDCQTIITGDVIATRVIP